MMEARRLDWRSARLNVGMGRASALALLLYQNKRALGCRPDDALSLPRIPERQQPRSRRRRSRSTAADVWLRRCAKEAVSWAGIVNP